jgi:hypothetical protein
MTPAPFWDFTQRRVVILYKDQAVLKMGPIGCPETSVIIINLRCVKSQKGEDSWLLEFLENLCTPDLDEGQGVHTVP